MKGILNAVENVKTLNAYQSNRHFVHKTFAVTSN